MKTFLKELGLYGLSSSQIAIVVWWLISFSCLAMSANEYNPNWIPLIFLFSLLVATYFLKTNLKIKDNE